MNWHKTNVALIAILLIIDVFLGIMLAREYKTARRIPDELIAEAEENLAQKNIFFNQQIIDKNIYTKKVFSYSAPNLFAGEMRQNATQTHPCLLSALAFLSEQSIQSINETAQYFDIPGSTSVSVYKKDGSVFGTASVMDTHTLEFSKSGIDTQQLREKATEIIQSISFDMSELPCPRAVFDFINSVYGGDIGIKNVFSADFNGYSLYACVYSCDGIELKDFPVCFYIKGGNIDYIYGSFLFDTLSAEYNAKLVDGINILYGLTEQEQYAKVNSQKLAYTLLNTDNGETYIIPVWTINYSDAENNPLFATFNALTGKKIDW